MGAEATADVGTRAPGAPAEPTGGGARAAQAAAALAAAGDQSGEIDGWATRFALLGDVNRLRILLALHRAPGLSVTELAESVGMSDNAASHALAGLRVAGVVAVDRDGRFRRWSIADEEIHAILHAVGASHSDLHPNH